MQRLISFLILLTYSFSSQALETITIDRGQAEPILLAINYFNIDSAADKKLADDLIQIIANDLKKSGLFRPVDCTTCTAQTRGIKHQPLFTAWQQINAELLINGQVTRSSANNLKVSIILWDVVLGKNLLSQVFELPVNLWRRVAHKVADKIYQNVTGDRGYFDSKIVYISETGPYLKRVKRVALMDYDGANHQYLTDGRNLVLTPRFSPKTDKILYLSYVNRTAKIYMLDLKSGQRTIISKFPGISFAPHFSPCGNYVVMSIAADGATHIYQIDLRTMKRLKLTSGLTINTSPSYSPDGSKIVFNSDRSGLRQLYIMNVDGSNLERVSFGRGNYSTPRWSPRGDYLAFTKVTKSEGFTIGIMKPKLKNNFSERIIASGYLVEGPCWAPNGRVIMFAKGEPAAGKAAGRNRLYSVNLTGYNEQEIITIKDASDPDWSQILD